MPDHILNAAAFDDATNHPTHPPLSSGDALSTIGQLTDAKFRSPLAQMTLLLALMPV